MIPLQLVTLDKKVPTQWWAENSSGLIYHKISTSLSETVMCVAVWKPEENKKKDC